MNYRTQQVKLSVDDETNDLIVRQCEAANSLFNSVLYYVRQEHFAQSESWNVVSDVDDAPKFYRKMKPISASYAKLCAVFKNDPNYKILGGQCAQQTIKFVCEAVKAFNSLLKLYFRGELNQWSGEHRQKSSDTARD